MRRLVGVIAASALAAALAFGIAPASLTPADGAAFDLRPQLMLRLFGESSDSRASLAAAYGDRTSESPFRDLALGTRAEDGSGAFAGGSSGPTFA